MSKIEQRSSDFLRQVMAAVDPEKRDAAAQRIAMAVRIQDAIASKRMSKLEFAALMGKHPSEISKWLSGRHNFTLDTLSAIQSKLGLKLIVTEETKQEVSQTFVAVVIGQSTSKFLGNWDDTTRQNESVCFVSEYTSRN